MKKSHLIASAFIVASLSFYGCSNTSTENTDDAAAASEVEKVPTKDCKLTSFTFAFGENTRTMNFNYDGEGDAVLLSSVKVGAAGKDEQEMNFTYNESGNISSFSMGESKANYNYDENGRLNAIEGEGNLSNRKFEYNEAGQIVKQVTFFGENPYTTHEYEYDENDTPVKVTIYDKNGEATDETTLTYDDKVNPFRNCGVFANSREMFFGYPVGNYKNNVVGYTKKYLKKSAYQVNGEYKNVGDLETEEINLEYNDDGYPSGWKDQKGDNEVNYELTYECK